MKNSIKNNRGVTGLFWTIFIGLLIWITLGTLIKGCVGQQIVTSDSITIVGEKVNWIDVIDTTLNVVVDYIPYLDQVYEFYVKFISDTSIADTLLQPIGIISANMPIERSVILTSLGKGKYIFGYRPISGDATTLAPQIHWSIDNSINRWYVNYVPAQFIIKKIRNGNFIGIVIKK